MKRFFALLLGLLLLGGCESTGAAAPSPGDEVWTAFEALGVSRSLLDQCQARETESGQTEYTLESDGEVLTLRRDAAGRVVFLSHRKATPSATPQPLETFLPLLDAIRKAYGAGDFPLRTGLWPEYQAGDGQVTLEYTKAYHGVWNSGESIAFCLDLTSGVLTEYALSLQPPLETAQTLSRQEAERIAREQMARGVYQPWAAESFLQLEAFDRETVPETEMLFFQRKLSYRVAYTVENAYDSAAFEKNGKAVPQEPVTYGVWVAAGDGTVLHTGPVTEFFAEETVLPLL